MFANFKVLFFTGFIFFTNLAHAEFNEKFVILVHANEITAKILNVVKQDLLFNKKPELRVMRVKIESILSAEESIDVLFTLARISRSYSFPGRAEDQLIDDALDEMWRSCIRRIEQIGGENAIDSLELLKETPPIDGAYGLLLQRSINNLKMKMRLSATGK